MAVEAADVVGEGATRSYLRKLQGRGDGPSAASPFLFLAPDRLTPPDPYKSGRLPWLQQVNKCYLEMTGTLERVYFTAPFSLAANVRGYENLVDDMYARPDFVHRLFKFLCDEVLGPHIEAMRTEVGLSDLILDGRDACRLAIQDQ